MSLRPDSTSTAPEPCMVDQPVDIATPNDLDRLRTILLQDDRREWCDLRKAVDQQKPTPEGLSPHLPAAIHIAASQGTALAESLGPTLADAFQQSVKKNPQSLVDAISPIMGPAIRQYISQAIRGMVESLNQTVEQSLSLRSLGWRWEAWKTGRPFGEIVLLHTLLFRVEQVFLIHRKTGLLLHHCYLAGTEMTDPDLVSAMLTAIQDFVHDSFGGSVEDTLRSLNVGSRLVWVEPGPSAVMACVIEGHPPAELRAIMSDQLDSFHRDMARSLEHFSGDNQPFRAAEHYLTACLLTQHQPGASRKQSSVIRWAIAAIPVAGLVFLANWCWSAYHTQLAWRDLVTTIDQQPGIVVTGQYRQGQRYVVEGLRDALASDPNTWIDQQTEISPQHIQQRWSTYASLEPEFVERRLQTALKLPQGILANIKGGEITLTGKAEPAWIVNALPALSLVPGVTRVDTSQLVCNDNSQPPFLDRLHSEPGYLVTRDKWERGVLYVHGLRDPLARPLETLFTSEELAQLHCEWEPFASQHEPFVFARAKSLLAPPDSATLELTQGIIHVRGSASHAWLRRISTNSMLIPGVLQVDYSQCVDDDRAQWQRITERIDLMEVYFEAGLAEPTPTEHAKLDQVGDLMQQLLQVSQTLGLRTEVELTGYSVPTDQLTGDQIAQLRHDRVERIVKELARRGIPRGIWQTRESLLAGTEGSSRAPIPDDEPAKTKARRVTFRVQTW